MRGKRLQVIFYAAIVLVILAEAMRVYLIMPFPGSQRMNSLDLAYFLHKGRWVMRIGLWLTVASCAWFVFRARRKWIPIVLVVFAGAITYLTNFVMTADRIFLQPETLAMMPGQGNQVPLSSLIIGVENNGDARAYPIRYLAYHHQVQDKVGGKPVIVTYCSVCRSGRVFEPVVRGKLEKFRLVGMDHFNAMFEDSRTRSWWRQATGEAVAGRLKGEQLPEVPSQQMSLAQWLALYPHALIMQPDPGFISKYDTAGLFDEGRNTSHLTGTDTASWHDKSWVVGVEIDGRSKAYDWNRLKRQRVIHDSIGSRPIFVVLATDNRSFGAFERRAEEYFDMAGDTIVGDSTRYTLSGVSIDDPRAKLMRIKAYQEFWHSWREFHPDTERY